MKRPLLVLALCLAPQVLAAGPVGEFETALRDAYGSYRVALFATNAGDPGAAADARARLSTQWQALRRRWEGAPPPHYAEDPGFGETLARVDWLINKSSGQIVEGDLHGAHETLEGIRDELGALHVRNGIETFSDRMNAYHAAMEEVLGADLSVLDAAALGALREQAAILDYLARDLLSAPPPEGRDNPQFQALAQGLEASVETFLSAARTGEAEALRAAVKGLKKPYAMLFVKFG